jgi:hypothetical protein
MSIASLPLAAVPLAAEGASVSSSGVGVLAPFTGFGLQGSSALRGERLWATETRARWRARESDSEMLGTTDKDPAEKVWYECDFLDVLNGASITELVVGADSPLVVLSTQTVSNGAQVHLARALVVAGDLGVTSRVRFQVQCSDGAYRKRSLRVRGREL